MASIFTKRIWQPCICQPNELKREIKKKTGGAKRGAKQKSGEAIALPGPPLESPLAPVPYSVVGCREVDRHNSGLLFSRKAIRDVLCQQGDLVYGRPAVSEAWDDCKHQTERQA